MYDLLKMMGGGEGSEKLLYFCMLKVFHNKKLFPIVISFVIATVILRRVHNIQTIYTAVLLGIKNGCVAWIT